MRESLVRLVVVIHLAIGLATFGGLSAAGFDANSPDLGPWWSGFVVTNLGVFVGNLVMLLLVRTHGEARIQAAETRRQDLEDNRGLVVEQLRQLESERHKMEPSDYTRERAALLSVGAAASRDLAEGTWLVGGDDAAWSAATVVGATSPGTVPTGSGSVEALALRLRQERAADPELFDAALKLANLGSVGNQGGAWRGALTALVLIALVGFIGLAASQGSRTRDPGGSITGGDSIPAERPMAETTSPRESALQQRVTANPTDIEALNELTELALSREDQQGAMSANQKALDVDPTNADARVFRAVLVAFIGQLPKALEALDGVIVEHPTNVRAHVYRGLLSLRQDPQRAVEVLERAAALEPSPQIQALLDEARRRVSGGEVASEPVPPPAPTQGAAGSPSLLASGTLTLAEPSAQGQRVFVSLRDPRGGPPLAAVVLAPGPFPMTFEITTANRVPMMGGSGELPAQMVLVARLDGDGDAMSRPPSDPSATVEGVSAGTSGLELQLARTAP